VFYINFNVNKSREDLAFFRKRYNDSEKVDYIYGFVVITIGWKNYIYSSQLYHLRSDSFITFTPDFNTFRLKFIKLTVTYSVITCVYDIYWSYTHVENNHSKHSIELWKI